MFSTFSRGDILAFVSSGCLSSEKPDILSSRPSSSPPSGSGEGILAFALSARFIAARTLDAFRSSNGSVGRFDSLQITFHTTV